MVEAERVGVGGQYQCFTPNQQLGLNHSERVAPVNSIPAFSILKPRLSPLCLYYSAPTHSGDKGYTKITKTELREAPMRKF